MTHEGRVIAIESLVTIIVPHSPIPTNSIFGCRRQQAHAASGQFGTGRYLKTDAGSQTDSGVAAQCPEEIQRNVLLEFVFLDHLVNPFRWRPWV